MLAVAATDDTFEPARVDGRECLAGKCIHCGRAVVVPFDGSVPASATVEHILPRAHGGTDDLANLALACARCNAAKGKRLDHRRLDDPTLQQVIATLRRRREERLREAIRIPS